MDELDELIEQYEEKFGEMIPLKMISLSEKKLEKILRECLKIGKPYEIDEETKKLMKDRGVDF